MSKENREFKGIWFPAEVWLDKRLTALEKIILMEIDSLDNDSHCYASNEHLAEFCQCSQSKVSGAISKLKSLGYVRVKSFDGRKRILESCLTVSIGQTTKKEKSAQQNLEQRVLDESSSKNTKEDKDGIPFSEIIDYLNEKAHRGYKPTTQKTREHIRARWNEGYTLDDFKRVIDVKCAEWLGDPKMDKYLCPDTLFGTKFEKYLNQPMHIRNNDEQNMTQEKVDMSAYSKKTGTYVMRDGKQYVWIDEEHLEEVKESHNNEGEDFDDIPY